MSQPVENLDVAASHPSRFIPLHYELTWGAVLMAWQAADLGHDFYESFYVLQDGALELQSGT